MLLQLRELQSKDEIAFNSAVAQWQSDPGFNFLLSYEPGMNFSDYLALLSDFKFGKNLQPGWVPATSYFAFVDRQIVGRVNFRHILNDFLKQYGGHIGYGVLPGFRRRGFAREMLSQSLVFAKNRGLEKVLLTCDDTNQGSIKTIETNGGILENIIPPQNPGSPAKRRYWINL